jgi:hypothetical protein
MRTKPLLTVLSIWLLTSGSSLAQSDEAARAAARQLGNEGIDLYEKGDYEPALDRLSRAYAVVRAPTLGLWLARALDKNGKLVRAAERYREVTRYPLNDQSPPQFHQAQADASKELPALEARIPSVIVRIEGAEVDEVLIQLNGNPLRSAFVGVAVPVNPGTATVEGTFEGKTVTQTAELKEGDKKKSLVLQFAASAAPPAGAAPPAAAPASAAPSPTPAPSFQPAGATPASPAADTGTEPGFVHTTLPWIALGVGGAGLIGGGVAGLIALNKKSSLDDGNCWEGNCGTWAQDDVDTYNQMRILTTVGLVVGGVGIATGVTLLLTAPKSPEQPPPATARVEPWVGLGSAGMRGVF